MRAQGRYYGKPMRWFQRHAVAVHRRLFDLSGGRRFRRFGRCRVGVLTTTGRRSGVPRPTPLFVFPDGDAWIVVASNGGTDGHPAWYLNLRADPAVRLRVDGRNRHMTASTLDSGEHADWWRRVNASYRFYDTYQRKTAREIPLVRLRPVSESERRMHRDARDADPTTHRAPTGEATPTSSRSTRGEQEVGSPDPVPQPPSLLPAPVRKLFQATSGQRWFTAVGPVLFPPLDRLLHRLTGGRVIFSERVVPSLVLYTTGASTGLTRTTPLATMPDEQGGYYVVGSNFGRPTHPAWTGNLLAHPEASVWFGGVRTPVRARLIGPDERDALWQRLIRVWPGWPKYAESAGRELRIFHLTPTEPGVRQPVEPPSGESGGC